MATIDACSPTVPPSGPGLHPIQRRALPLSQLCKNCVVQACQPPHMWCSFIYTNAAYAVSRSCPP